MSESSLSPKLTALSDALPAIIPIWQPCEELKFLCAIITSPSGNAGVPSLASCTTCNPFADVAGLAVQQK